MEMAEDSSTSIGSTEYYEGANNNIGRTYPFLKRGNPHKHKDKVCIGCGAGFAGDRPMAAFKLLQRVDLDYIVLECLAERTLAERYNEKEAGGHGYDTRLEEWMRLLLPLAIEKGTCIITNMGAVNAVGAQGKVLDVANSLGININVGVAHHVFTSTSEVETLVKDGVNPNMFDVYLGAAPIVECLETCKPDVIITSRVADAALFLAPMVYELGWDWDEVDLVAQGTLAGHLLECGCQLTGGYFMHPGDSFRDMPLPSLLDLSLPYAEVSSSGQVCVAKAEGSGGVLNVSTCSQQLLYEVGDPGAYITPDLIVDFRDVTFQPLSSCKVLCFGARPADAVVPYKLLLLAPKDCGWKGWGEISYGGHQCVKRAEAAEYLVRAWMEEVHPGNNVKIISYILGLDSIKATSIDNIDTHGTAIQDIRLRMDGLFEHKEHAVQFTKEFTALYTNGPAGGGGISTGFKKEIILERRFIRRENVNVKVDSKKNDLFALDFQRIGNQENKSTVNSSKINSVSKSCTAFFLPRINSSPAEAGKTIPLYKVAHSRAGDKGNDVNFSIIPHFLPDINRLKAIITPDWVRSVVATLLNCSSFPDSEDIRKRDEWVSENVKVEIYEARGIQSLNVVVRNILDGGVNCSRRIDRHGKSISDVILSQLVVLPP